MKKYTFTILNFEFNRTTKNSFKIHFLLQEFSEPSFSNQILQDFTIDSQNFLESL